MRKRILFSIFAAAVLAAAVSAASAAPLRIKVGITESINGVTMPVSGRLLIFMRKDDGKPTDGFGPSSSDVNAVWISGTEISELVPGKPVEIDPDLFSFPSPFTSAAAGDYQLFALLDRDHTATYGGPAGGDLYSQVLKVSMPASAAELTLQRMIPERKIEVPANFRLIEFESPMLSKFWGRPIKMKASVLLPPSYAKSKDKYPTIYSISGYGGTHLNPLRGAAARDKEMLEGKRPEMITVFLEAQHSLGHHVWADSVNNGPWGTALVKEFIPYLESQFRMDAKPSGRFLTGHSSGGWATLWTMIQNPDFFGGTWSTSPDPVDFRNFTGPNIYDDANAFTAADGKEHFLVRDKGVGKATIRHYAQQERVVGHYGGQMAAFNAVFSPRGEDGQPMKLFNFDTGRIDPEVAKAWQKYDISLLLRTNWKTLEPKLKGKLHIWVGTEDTFHLDRSLRLLDAELKKLGSDAEVTYLEGKTHFDVMNDGLMEKIQWDMYKIARPKAKQPK
ncbi:MAG: alpha/beta hydrolase-fold protein [Pyrinomonadaceae bacterium]|nr:alpha/beta hydrolase-fold protein [Pyrinomonadaceae bacterium]